MTILISFSAANPPFYERISKHRILEFAAQSSRRPILDLSARETARGERKAHERVRHRRNRVHRQASGPAAPGARRRARLRARLPADAGADRRPRRRSGATAPSGSTFIEGDISKPDLGVVGEGRCASSRARSTISSISPPSTTSRPSRQQVVTANVAGVANALAFAKSDQGGLLPSRELDRGGRSLRRRVPRGHVRGGARARPSLLLLEAQGRGPGAGRDGDPLADLSSRHRRRRFEDRRDRQDRRPLLLLQADPEAARRRCPPGFR